MIKLIVSDMDGTLLNSDHVISERNMEAIKFARDNGVEFLIATGRAHYEAMQPISQANLKTELICLNGAMTYDEKGNLISSINLDLEDISFISETFKKFGLDYQLYTPKCLYTESIEANMQAFIDLVLVQGHEVNIEAIKEETKERVQSGHLVEVANIDDYLNDANNPVVKIMTVSKDMELLKKVREELEINKNISVTSSGVNNIEITNAKASKGQAVKNVAKEKGISLDNTMVLGDNLNDLSMIELAKYSVAINNGNPELIKKASYISDFDNDKNGVGEMIFKLLKGENSL
ncbi:MULTISPECIES: Cof-type HAD-IIB family hydrolase [unclassified Gemella]|uniref:Cof-type HAD-IIB family hydrolase n=1 Tax=unclassified Gemella TaxID=2624949 RepID=UPI001430AF58|nr:MULTISPECIES: Cof-type HAD-IIB family hydrolase [unclassified Gemella]MBF0710311.1 HAD family phosphatase [Gemella sp. GL1.1]MBF0746987.1 HAD family phosphatase [Gemella sp. 19428wG2_WT2a]NYS27655.1 HAD family phosphatase [Gemella sp. GL1]